MKVLKEVYINVIVIPNVIVVPIAFFDGLGLWNFSKSVASLGYSFKISSTQ